MANPNLTTVLTLIENRRMIPGDYAVDTISELLDMNAISLAACVYRKNKPDLFLYKMNDAIY